MQKRIKSYIGSILKFGFAFAIIYWMVSRGVIDIDALKAVFSPGYFFLGLMIVGITTVILSERWRWLLKAQGIDKGFFEIFQLTLMGIFFNYVVPGGVGGDVVKAYYTVKDNPTKKVAAAMSVLVDRVLGLYAMLLLSLGFMMFDEGRIFQVRELTLIFQSLLGVFIVFTLALGFAFSRRVAASGWDKVFDKIPLGAKLKTVYRSVHEYGRKRDIILKVIGVSLIGQSVMILNFILVGKAMNLDVPTLAYFFVVPLGFMVTAIPVSPAGVGVGQVAFYMLFNLYLGKETNLGSTAITVVQVLQFIFGLFGAWFFIQRKGSISQLEEAETL